MQVGRTPSRLESTQLFLEKAVRLYIFFKYVYLIVLFDWIFELFGATEEN